MELPADRVRPVRQSFVGGSCGFEVAGGVRDGLVRLARAEGATLFMVLLAAFKVLLFRYSGQWDVVVGTPIANRTRAEV